MRDTDAFSGFDRLCAFILAIAEVYEYAIICVEVGGKTHLLGKMTPKLFAKRKILTSAHRVPRVAVPAAAPVSFGNEEHGKRVVASAV